MDDIEFELGPSEPKRPRVGRQPRDILDTIEQDTQCDAQRKNLRSALLRLGELRTFQDIAFSTLFKNQALAVAGLIASDSRSGVLLVLERCVCGRLCPQQEQEAPVVVPCLQCRKPTECGRPHRWCTRNCTPYSRRRVFLVPRVGTRPATSVGDYFSLRNTCEAPSAVCCRARFCRYPLCRTCSGAA